MDSSKNNTQLSTLLVCTANQCRSPMGEALLKQYIQSQGYTDQTWIVASAGCWAYPDQTATKNAILTADNLGCSLHLHSSQAVSEKLLQKFHLILCMEAEHRDFIKRNFPAMAEKVFLFSKMIDKEFDIDDPVGGTIETYSSTAQELNSIIVSGFQKIMELSTR